ncbi:MAG TPA: KH domain-containing protein [Candidatus Baltobacteraceae bacterium]|nr:KH domain-containing protein [Candidatus Baltobacteraceae bacterium]
MSAFDDEFGLFGEGAEEGERRSTLGARKIASNETIIDDIEPEDEAPRKRGERGPRHKSGGGRRQEQKHREPADPEAARERAGRLLAFLAKKLVAKPDAVTVDYFPPENGESAVIELVVDPDDLGKVIGKNGRVAQALRTVVRATAEGRISVEIFDSTEVEGDDGGEDAEDDAELD